MDRKNRGFINWYFNIRNSYKERSIVFNIGSYFGQNYLTVRDNQEEVRRVFNISVQQLKIEKDGIFFKEHKLLKNEIFLDLKEKDFTIKGEVSISGEPLIYPSKRQKSMMGPIRYIPFLKNYYELICLNAPIQGFIQLNDENIDLMQGTAYIEKQWGREYPKVWVSAQCNCFKNHPITLMMRINRIALLWEYETVFSILINYRGRIELFSNYRGGHITKLYRYKSYVHVIITQKNKLLDLKLFGEDGLELVEAKYTHGIKDIYQCSQGKIEIKIIENNHKIIEDIGYRCEVEMGGNTSKLK